MIRPSTPALVGLALVLCACGSRSTSIDATPGRDGPRASDGATASDGSSTQTGQLKCTGYTMPSFSKACAKAADCAIVSHQTDCCGSTRAIGVSAGEKAGFEAEENKCAATYPGCGCPAGPPVTDDGSKALGSVSVECVAGSCTTFSAACQKPCAGGATCRTCIVKTTTYAVCSKSCTSDSECTEPGLTTCEADGFGGKFCTANVGCGTK